MDFDKLAELLAFLFYDHAFKGDPVELWKAVIDLVQQLFSKIGDLFG